MNTHAENTAPHESQAASNSFASQSVGNKSTFQLKDNRPQSIIQQKQVDALANKTNAELIQKKANNTGLPDNLKAGVENLSGFSMDDVKVHYNSAKPAQLQAHAYAQGTDIHIAPGQEKHLPHEAWHVVQQKQGRVQATVQMKGGVGVNDDKGLESEADVMGSKAKFVKGNLRLKKVSSSSFLKTIQRINLLNLVKNRTIQGVIITIGGTGRSAAESFNLSPHKARTFLRLNSHIQASTSVSNGGHLLHLHINGTGYTDPISGHLQGLSRPGTWFEKLKSKILGLGPGNIIEQRNKVLQAVGSVKHQFSPNAKIHLQGYSRGAVTVAALIPKLSKMFPDNRIYSKLFDPVAGPLHQRVYPVNFNNTDTRVQYSLLNWLPKFHATPIHGATGIVLAQGGHSTATREQTGRLGNLHSYPPGIQIENSEGKVVPICVKKTKQYLDNMHAQSGSYVENPQNSSRFTEMKSAINAINIPKNNKINWRKTIRFHNFNLIKRRKIGVSRYQIKKNLHP